MFEIKNLSAGYSKNLLIKNLSFFLPDATFLAIIGHNGSGKSTLLKAITNQIPFKGEILLNNQILKNNKYIATLNQQNDLKFSITVRELVVMGKFSNKKFFESYSEKDFFSVEEVLNALNIQHLADKNFTILSGGEKQLVWLAQMMIQNCDCFLLDEPTQSLDVYNKKRIFNLMFEWVNIYKKNVICITHDLLNLYSMNGYLINISKENPTLEILNEKTIDENRFYLENNPLKDLNLVM